MIAGVYKAAGIVVACVTVCLFEGGCSTMKPLRYAVDIVNDGKERIAVDPFDIVEGTHSTVAVGEVNPGGTAGMSPFYRRPIRSFTVAWRILSTGERGRALVMPELPKEFTKERGSSIILRIRPEEQQVEVTYEIMDPRSGNLTIIRQGDQPLKY
jgi:hypothetical protein